MKTQPWNRKQFRKLAEASVILAGGWLMAAQAAMGQQANGPATDQTNAPATTAADTEAQAKARKALEQAESALNTNAPAAPQKSGESDTSDLNNWVEFGVGGNIVGSGNKAQEQRQSGLPANTAFGGIESFHYEQPVEKKGLFTIDGRGIFDNHDYDITLKVQHPDVGYVVTGFRQFREYYDGNGGYLPSNGGFFALPNQELAVDRGSAFLETGLTLPDWPVLKIRYEHDYRSGDKDSTEWGVTDLTGPGGASNAANPKQLTPTILQLDEKTDTVSAGLTHAIGNTAFGLDVAYVWQSIDDSHITLQQPGEGAASRTLDQEEPNKTDSLSAHAFTDTKLNDKLEFTTGGEYTTLHERLEDGSRVDSPYTSTATDTRFVNLAGGSDMDQYTANFNLQYSPTENLYIVPAFRADTETYSGTDSDNALTTPAGVPTVGALTLNQDYERMLNLAESLDIRYTGLTNWVLYLRGDWEENHSHLDMYSGGTIPLPQTLDQVWDQWLQKYTAGVNWYPQRGLNFAASYNHEIDDNNYANAIPAQPSTVGYPGYIQEENFITDNVDFRMTWRPFSALSLVSRYVFTYSTIDMQGGYEGSPATTPTSLIQSGKTVTHNLGETISWTPLSRLFVQASANYVLDSTHSPAESYSGGSILESMNNYWTVNTLIGYAINDKTDVRAGYTYYRAADYTDNSALGVPYGAGGEETSVTAALGRQITRKIHAALHYSFTDYHDELFGGNLDYKGHTIMASLKYRF